MSRAAYRSVRVHNGTFVPRPKIQCPLCDATTYINADGTLRKHRQPPGSASDLNLIWDFRVPAGPVCEMSNR